MIFLVFSKVLLNFSTNVILVLFGTFGFQVNKASIVISDIQLNCLIIKFFL